MCQSGAVTDFVIDVWSDVVCPFCYLGSVQLLRAVENFDHRGQVVIRPRAFELDTRTPTEVSTPLAELVARKYSMPIEQAEAFHRELEAEAAALGMNWHFEKARVGNSFDAHRLIALAGSQGLSLAMAERLFRAYFSEGLLISNHAVLDQLAAEVGVTDSHELWSSDDWADDVRADEAQALELGITGVPSMLIDGRFMVVGAQSPEALLDVLQRAWARRAQLS